MRVIDWGEVSDVFAALCLVGGALLNFTAGIGVLRFPDLFSRMHAATKPQVLGVLLILTGAALRLHTWADATMLLLAGLFQMMTTPVATHMIGRAVYRSAWHEPELLLVDELADRTRPEGG